MPSFFSSNRLLFRSWNESDRMVFREMNRDPEVLEFLHPAMTAGESDSFVDLKFNEVFSFTTRSNVRSVKVMEKIGMKYAGSFDHPKVPMDDPLRPHLLYRIATGV